MRIAKHLHLQGAECQRKMYMQQNVAGGIRAWNSRVELARAIAMFARQLWNLCALRKVGRTIVSHGSWSCRQHTWAVVNETAMHSPHAGRMIYEYKIRI